MIAVLPPRVGAWLKHSFFPQFQSPLRKIITAGVSPWSFLKRRSGLRDETLAFSPGTDSSRMVASYPLIVALVSSP